MDLKARQVESTENIAHIWVAQALKVEIQIQFCLHL